VPMLAVRRVPMLDVRTWPVRAVVEQRVLGEPVDGDENGNCRHDAVDVDVAGRRCSVCGVVPEGLRVSGIEHALLAARETGGGLPDPCLSAGYLSGGHLTGCGPIGGRVTARRLTDRCLSAGCLSGGRLTD